MRYGLLTTVVVLAVAPDASAFTGALVPIWAAEGHLRGLPAGTPGRFGGSENTLAQVGDVNGDGFTDVAVAAPAADVRGRRDAGAVHVLFGGTALGRIDVGKAPGFRILGPKQGKRRPLPVFEPHNDAVAGARAGTSVAGAGDVNGDGLADLVVGAPFTGNRKRAFSGSAYVVFGQRSTAAVDLARLGTKGFRIDGPRRDAAAGVTVAGPGDVTGDGRPDVLVRGGITQRSTVYVVRGKAGSAPVDLRRLGRDGFAIRGRRLLDVGTALSGAGDFNGDRVADIAVGAPQSGPAEREGAGHVFVVFGGAHRGTVDLDALGARGVAVLGEHEFANFGEALAPLGDTDGDGRGDLLAGASQVTEGTRDYAGAAYVIYGRTAGDVDLRAPAGAAFRILGPSAGEGQARAGGAVAALPDVNGDGRMDLLIGASGAGRRCSPEEGAAFVVFTPATATPLDLDALGPAGYAITGVTPADGVGSGVAAAGDWNRDGRGDALILRDPFPLDEPPRAPRLDLVLGRVPVVPAAPTPEQLPRVNLPRPQVRELASARGLETTVTVPAARPGDTLFLEVRTAVFGESTPLAAAFAEIAAPGARTLLAKSPKEFRDAFRRRTKLPVEIIVSQCTASGQVYEARTQVELR